MTSDKLPIGFPTREQMREQSLRKYISVVKQLEADYLTLTKELLRKDTEIHDLEVVLAAKIKSYECLLNVDNR